MAASRGRKATRKRDILGERAGDLPGAAPLRKCPLKLFGPSEFASEQQSQTLFNYLIGPGKQRRGEVETKCPGGLEINYQLEFGRLLNRQLGRLGAFKYLIDVLARTPPKVRKIRTV